MLSYYLQYSVIMVNGIVYFSVTVPLDIVGV